MGDQVVVTAADSERNIQSILCFDRTTGQQLWETVVHENGLDVKSNEKSSMASASAACDGDRFFVNFLNGDSVYMTAFDRQGKEALADETFELRQSSGISDCCRCCIRIVIGVSDNKGGGAIVAMNRATGAIVWNIKTCEGELFVTCHLQRRRPGAALPHRLLIL